MKIVIVGGRRLIDLDDLLKDIGEIPEGEISEYDEGRLEVRNIIEGQPIIEGQEVAYGNIRNTSKCYGNYMRKR